MQGWVVGRDVQGRAGLRQGCAGQGWEEAGMCRAGRRQGCTGQG